MKKELKKKLDTIEWKPEGEIKKQHLNKVALVILKARFVIYWKTIIVLINNISYDVTLFASRIFDVIKLILLVIFGLTAVPVMIFCSPLILLIYLPFST